MPDAPPETVTMDRLRELTLSDLVSMSDAHGTGAVEALLSEGIDVVSGFLADHGKRVETVPAVVYDPLESGVTYDPYYDHDDGVDRDKDEVLVIGGPRGLLRGGEQVLRDRGLLSQKALLSILCKGLLHSYNHELVTRHFEAGGRDQRTGRGQIELYDRFRMLNPAVDEGVAQLFMLYLNADITDTELREAYIGGWVEWYRNGDLDDSLFEAVAYTIGDRVDAAEGSAKERFVHGLAIQEPLIRDGNVSVIEERLRASE